MCPIGPYVFNAPDFRRDDTSNPRTSKQHHVISVETHGLDRWCATDRAGRVGPGCTEKPDETIDPAVQGITWIGSAGVTVCPSGRLIDTDASAWLLCDARKHRAVESSWADANAPGAMVSAIWVAVALVYGMEMMMPPLSLPLRCGMEEIEQSAPDRFVIRSSTVVITWRVPESTTNASACTSFPEHAAGPVPVGVSAPSALRASLRFVRAAASFGFAATARVNNTTACRIVVRLVAQDAEVVQRRFEVRSSVIARA